MTPIETIGQAQPALGGAIFRRVAQSTKASSVPRDVPAEVSGGQSNQHLSITPPQSVGTPVKEDAGDQGATGRAKPRLIIAVDFGTTYSSVSYAKIDPGVDSTTLPISMIRCISNYENAKGGSDTRANARTENVPTKLLYLGPRTADSERVDDDPDISDDPLSDLDVQPIPPPDDSHIRTRKRRRKSGTPNPRRRQKTPWSRAAGVTVRWGFSVQAAQEDAYDLAEYRRKEAVQLIKLTLGEDPREDVDLLKKRKELAGQIRRLRANKFVQDRDHLLRDYLARLLQHAKVVLEEDGLLEAAHLEYVLCVPVFWSESACRVMHDAMMRAIQACKLDVLTQELIPDLFIVSEPEAAAQYAIAALEDQGRLRQDEVFIILDAGGGTVDITTYKVTSSDMGPLRLEGEVIPPDGALCGSSLITERYRSKIKEKLRKVDPNQKDKLLDGLATALANTWDMFSKGQIDVAKKRTMGLELKKYHNEQYIKWTESEIRDVFEPSLKGTAELLKRQLELAKDKNLTVSKLVVVGGFGESPSLRARIREVLTAHCDEDSRAIGVLWPKDLPTSAVARGAVLRALDKRDGPSRISRSSFGFLRHEPYGLKEHREAKVRPVWDGLEHDNFVRNTIVWLIKAVSNAPIALLLWRRSAN